MEISRKIKSARLQADFTQEAVAEELQVSRQTISNWENGRTYPDIVSVIKMSDLYGISLDELLKGDRQLMAHLDESTNIVKSNKKLIVAIVINIVLFFALFVIAGFMSKSIYLMISIFCLATISVAFLLYQIVKRI